MAAMLVVLEVAFKGMRFVLSYMEMSSTFSNEYQSNDSWISNGKPSGQHKDTPVEIAGWLQMMWAIT